MKRRQGTVSTGITTARTIRFACWLVFLLICWGNGQEALAASRFIKYLYVEANEGDSSGGHTAIRFEEQTFHFQHENSGIIRITRLDSAAFDHAYAMLGNRTIRESWIAVSAETYTILRDGFIRLFFIQGAQLDMLHALQRDVALFELLLKQVQIPGNGADEAVLPLKGLGYFLPAGATFPQSSINSPGSDANGAAPSSAALLKLQERIRAVYGDRFIEERLTRARAALNEMVLQAATTPLPGLSRDSYPRITPYASTAYEDALLDLSALELLQSAPPLLPDTSWSSPADPFRLTSAEILFLRAFAGQLENDLLQLVASSRSDRGFPLIAGMARLAAVETSIATERLVLLDLFPGDARTSEQQTCSGQRYLPAMKKESQELFLQKRREFFAGQELREADYAALELAGNLFFDLEQALADNTVPHRFPETGVPARKGWRNGLLFPGMDAAALQSELAKAQAAEMEYAAALTNIYAYDLVRRNCVTEIFAAINSTLEWQPPAGEQAGEASAAARTAGEESLLRLGGFMDASRGLTFVPFISAGEVNSCYAVTSRHEQLSYRAEQLAEMKKREAALLVFLREANTITSTIYHPAPGDSPFLFFTDDTILLRPVFGAFNLLVGLGDSLLGLLTLPFEGPRRLQLGAKGMLFSLPELVFVNLRKGSLEYVAQRR